MRIIPVIDLMGGVVVRGVGGIRQNYRPIETALGRADDAPALARALLGACGGDTLYIADLDAITGRPPQGALLREIAAANPGVALWLDAGVATAADLAALPVAADPVIGSETIGVDLVHRIPRGCILSLDFAGERWLGPEALLRLPRLWPDRIVAMTLAAVGARQGPDLARLGQVVEMARGRAVYAAGGVRSAADIAALAQLGCAGALVATALHEGAL